MLIPAFLMQIKLDFCRIQGTKIIVQLTGSKLLTDEKK